MTGLNKLTRSDRSFPRGFTPRRSLGARCYPALARGFRPRATHQGAYPLEPSFGSPRQAAGYNQNQKELKAFTIIEILLTVSIIGILATTVIISAANVKMNGRDSKRLADIKTIKTVLGMYYIANSVFPLSMNNGTDWCATYLDQCGGSLSTWISNLAPTYIQALPGDPINNNEHRYNYRSDNTDYKLISRGLEGVGAQNLARNDNGCRPSPPSPNCINNVPDPHLDYEIFTSGARLW